jgi:hypothetical protein
MECENNKKRMVIGSSIYDDTVKSVYKGHSGGPNNVPFISSCPLYTG